MTEIGVDGERDGEQQSKAGQAQERLQQRKQQLQEKAQPLVGQAREKTQERADQLRGQAATRVRSQLDARSTQAGEQVSSIAQAVRTSGERLRDQGQERPAKAIEEAAERAERLATYLTESDGERILRDIEDFARRQPWVVAVLGAATGFLVSRFLKSSASGERESDGRPSEIPEWSETPRRGGAPMAQAAPVIDSPPTAPRGASTGPGSEL